MVNVIAAMSPAVRERVTQYSHTSSTWSCLVVIEPRTKFGSPIKAMIWLLVMPIEIVINLRDCTLCAQPLNNSNEGTAKKMKSFFNFIQKCFSIFKNLFYLLYRLQ